MDNCLCYSKDKGLYTKYLLPDENPEELLFRSHDSIWRRSLKKMIPNSNISVEIFSKFSNNNNAYFYSVIKKNDAYILDFDTTKMTVLNNCSVRYHCAIPNDWNSLFEKIIKAYKSSFCDVAPASAIGYLDCISDLMRKDSIMVKNSFYSEREVKWEGVYLITLRGGKKLLDFIDGLEKAQIDDKTIVAHTLDVCRQFLIKINNQQLNYDDKRTVQIADILFAIHSFMNKHDKGIEFLKFYQEK